MKMALEILLLVAPLPLLGILAAWFGADTRDGRDWQPRSDSREFRM
jgi:hypothetical protein